jgi:hypothetical protein
MAGRLIGGRFEKSVAFSTPATRSDDSDFIVLRDFKLDFTGFRVFGYGAQWHVQNDVVSIRTALIGPTPVDTWRGNHVFAVFQGKECPYVAVSTQNDVPSAAAVSAVGAPH